MRLEIFDMKNKFWILLTILLAPGNDVLAQAGAGQKLGPGRQAYVDSIKNSDYKWIFPAWGKRISKKGFDLPMPVGIMLNPYAGSQKITISDLQVGFNDNEPVPLEFVKFGEVKASIQSITVRPDVWVLPFMDLYAIGGFTWSKTDVNVVGPIQFNTVANFQGTTLGLGSTFAGGYHGLISIIDLNHTWSHIDEIKGSIQATMFTPRIGYSFLFRKKPAQRIAFWIGAPGIFINRTTEGSIDINNINTDASKDDLESVVNGTAEWWQGLSLAQQEVTKKIASAALDKINGIRPDELIISYSLNKKPVSNWSMCVGGQLQLSHRWQVRTEVGFFGGRRSLLLSGNYRFRL